ncbi:hypothetical protein SDC9_97957 [bioreactor metagenome]|jgi:hypothetical protein|uniref:DUF5611 domain-containing protein n=1 Tax=bioreactor metagenome TaxID=1076179 RepID=A0A645ADG8_9ZZZZ|nr:hypothetical protein AOA81_04010 [Methanomassiliicoccales archaeon RumEn M2]MDD2532918.1 DUF5611 family protein [Candidatus Methanomethylophilaceae archaeon]MDD3128525.1 DUF5611 family protein [Candidatus Methanomethylophilaceae archaeon]MDD4454956.1 DUF5611 family protein [Candidatus Methanomethylophilaceae archaeon]MDI9378414.1 DUF5611 family protein [Candidatus Thermoplasmatota archaeon]
MVEYDIKKGWHSKIEGDKLREMMERIFGNARTEGNMVVSEYGILSRIEAEILSKTSMHVATESAKDGLTDEAILDAKRKLNVFVEEATGFDVKARKKRAQDKAKKGY